MTKSVKRSGPNNSRALVSGLRALTDLGMPLDEAMRVGMGRFPVAGEATWSHDWWFPRFGPDWRLHLGTDVFAKQGTPLRSPSDGVVRLTNGGLGGRSTYVVQPDGTYFYLAHLDGWPEGLQDGQTVAVGDIVGYVGSSGNAEGGSPHLHFEVHPAVRTVTTGKGKRQTTKVVPFPVRPGTVLPAADPKPVLDAWLKEAIDNLPALVAAYQAALPLPPPAVASPQSVDTALVAPSLALTARYRLLDPSERAVSIPLIGLAFLLLLMVGSLTPVLGPSHALPATRARSVRTAPTVPTAKRKPKRKPKRKAKPSPEPSPEALVVAGTGDGIDGARRRRRRALALGAAETAVPSPATEHE